MGMTITIIIVLTTNAIQVSKDKDKKLMNYEKIRTVGKGAFGAAVLYRKKDDGLMVVIKVRDDACDNDKNENDTFKPSSGDQHARPVSCGTPDGFE